MKGIIRKEKTMTGQQLLELPKGTKVVYTGPVVKTLESQKENGGYLTYITLDDWKWIVLEGKNKKECYTMSFKDLEIFKE
jgi:hypothetical protein